ncbi:MAG: hypothetical protein CVT67_09040 [Actinobacteria bacterium HGW-Actinobacteria-7]|nr:MAG: hypothetical protein CVT67_09040 [Actinobacteria bacterium HGW-Actinobacteria-7]
MTDNNSATATPPVASATPRGSRFTPRAGVRVQLFSAALMWAIGASILIVRGVIYVSDRSWHSWLFGGGLAIAIAIPKSRYLLDRVAAKAVARIRLRGRSCYFGFFSWKSWLLVGTMMGGGIGLRHLIVHPNVIGAGIMGALYMGIGSALAIADRIFWLAALQKHLPYGLDAEAEVPAA